MTPDNVSVKGAFHCITTHHTAQQWNENNLKTGKIGKNRQCNSQATN